MTNHSADRIVIALIQNWARSVFWVSVTCCGSKEDLVYVSCDSCLLQAGCIITTRLWETYSIDKVLP